MVVRYFADIRKLAGVDEEEWTRPAATLRSLLGDLAPAHGAAFAKRVFDDGRLSSTVIILVNGRNIEHLNGLETPLGRDAVVAIFPMVAGG